MAEKKWKWFRSTNPDPADIVKRLNAGGVGPGEVCVFPNHGHMLDVMVFTDQNIQVFDADRHDD